VFALLLIVRADSFAFLDVHTHTQIAAFGFSPKHSRRNAFVNYQLVYERAPFLVYNYAKQFERAYTIYACAKMPTISSIETYMPLCAWENAFSVALTFC
jgi:hypothetical protein